MIVLLIAACWSALLILVAALCAAARLGDRQDLAACPDGADEHAHELVPGGPAGARRGARAEAPARLAGPDRAPAETPGRLVGVRGAPA